MPDDAEPVVAQVAEENPYAAPQLSAQAPLPVGSSAGGEMSSELLDELQRVANYRQMRQRLRRSGTLSVFFGVLAVGLGYGALHVNQLNAILLAIGVFLLVEGAWLIISPAPVGVILDGTGFLLVGIWNIGVAVLNAMAGHFEGGFLPLIGIFQICWGIQPISAIFSNAARNTGA